MKPTLLLPVLLVGAALSAGFAFDPDQGDVVVDQDAAADAVYCVLTSPRAQYHVGETPDLRVAIFNNSDQELYLVGSLDGSERQRRYPHVYYTVSGPPNGLRTAPLGYCGYLNGLRKEDFIHLRPGESFDPYMNVDSHGFFSAARLWASRFEQPGEYRFTFHYSTMGSTVEAWKGTPEQLPSDVLVLLKHVPRLEIECSVDLTVVAKEGGVPN